MWIDLYPLIFRRNLICVCTHWRGLRCQAFDNRAFAVRKVYAMTLENLLGNTNFQAFYRDLGKFFPRPWQIASNYLKIFRFHGFPTQIASFEEFGQGVDFLWIKTVILLSYLLHTHSPNTATYEALDTFFYIRDVICVNC